MSEFWAMGGYGAYVWTSYGITGLLLVLLFVWSWTGARARQTELEQIRSISRSDRRSVPSATLKSSSDDRSDAATGKVDNVDNDAGTLAAGNASRAGG